MEKTKDNLFKGLEEINIRLDGVLSKIISEEIRCREKSTDMKSFR